jgi:hypothetical protein
MYRCKYAGNPLTYGETKIYRYIHLTVVTRSRVTWRIDIVCIQMSIHGLEKKPNIAPQLRLTRIPEGELFK